MATLIGSRRPMRGFTLVEMAAVMAISGILMALALPSFNTLVLNNRVKTGVNDLHSSLYFARSEALKRGANVEIVPSGGNWKNGWIVRLAASGTALRTESSLGGNLNITQLPAGTITYRGDGRITNTAVPAIVVSSPNNASLPARCVSVDLSGRPRVTKDTDGNPANGCN